jgi:hypothetical protein
MTAGILVSTPDYKWMAIDRRFSGGGEYVDTPGSKLWSRIDEAAETYVAVAAAGDAARIQQLFAALDEMVPFSRRDLADWWREENVNDVDILVMTSDGDFYMDHSGAQWDVAAPRIETIGSGGMFLRGWLREGSTPDEIARAFAHLASFRYDCSAGFDLVQF